MEWGVCAHQECNEACTHGGVFSILPDCVPNGWLAAGGAAAEKEEEKKDEPEEESDEVSVAVCYWLYSFVDATFSVFTPPPL